MQTTPDLYLASRSPRRAEVLAQLGLRFEVVVADIDETHVATEMARELVVRLAADKAAAGLVAIRGRAPAPVLGADTVVVLDDRILGKPHDDEDAIEMLAALSGREHAVLTGVALATAAGVRGRISESRVRMRRSTDAERRAYVATGEPIDKAGAYAIQGLAAIFVEHLEGSYSGVMGLPAQETAVLLAGAGVNVLGR